MANDIVFRRIHGRIVPIKRKKDDSLAKDIAGGVSGGAGVATAIYAGKKAHSYQYDSAKIEARAMKKFTTKGQMNLFESQSAKKLFAKSKSLHKRRNLAIVAGAAIGAPLISYGLSRLQKNPDKERAKKIAGNIDRGFELAALIGTVEYARRLHDPRFNKNILKTLKKAFEYAKSRPLKQLILKGI